MKKLYLIYDTKNGFHASLVLWLTRQKTCHEFRYIPRERKDLETLFPGIDQFAWRKGLVAVDEERRVYTGEKAGIVVLHNLTQFRKWAARLARPALLPFAARALATMLMDPGALRSWMRLDSDADLSQRLERTYGAQDVPPPLAG